MLFWSESEKKFNTKVELYVNRFLVTGPWFYLQLIVFGVIVIKRLDKMESKTLTITLCRNDLDFLRRNLYAIVNFINYSAIEILFRKM